MSFLDWSQDPPPISDSQASVIANSSDADIATIYSDSLAGIKYIENKIGSLAVSLNLVHFDTLDTAVNDLTASWMGAASDSKTARFLVADHLSYVRERADAAYLTPGGDVKPQFTVTAGIGKGISSFISSETAQASSLVKTGLFILGGCLLVYVVIVATK